MRKLIDDCKKRPDLCHIEVNCTWDLKLAEQKKSRFERIMDYLKIVTEWQHTPKEDLTLVVDIAEIELQVSIYKDRVDELLSVEPIAENRSKIASCLAGIEAARWSILLVCEDLDGPLNRLFEEMCDEDEAEVDS